MKGIPSEISTVEGQAGKIPMTKKKNFMELSLPKF
jgi:hypothetical protein